MIFLYQSLNVHSTIVIYSAGYTSKHFRYAFLKSIENEYVIVYTAHFSTLYHLSNQYLYYMVNHLLILFMLLMFSSIMFKVSLVTESNTCVIFVLCGIFPEYLFQFPNTYYCLSFITVCTCIIFQGLRKWEQPSAGGGAYWWYPGDAARGADPETAGGGAQKEVHAGARSAASLRTPWRPVLRSRS